MSGRFQQAIDCIDAAHREDPSGEALEHARRRTYWVHQLRGEEAPEALLLAARAQHIRRWRSPRSDYPEGRTGYLRWRADLQKFHAQQAGEILLGLGYDMETVERVQALLQKRQLKQDPDTQTLEDALCLVFLERQFTAFARKEADKIADILRKTWRKMSAEAQAAALALPMSDADRDIIEQALTD